MTAIGNWADFCTAPRGTVIRHPAEPIDNFPHGAGSDPDAPEETNLPWGQNPRATQEHNLEVWRKNNDNRPDNLPMPGLRIESFFDAANMLTGSDLMGMGAVWDILRNDHNEFLAETMSTDGGTGDSPEVFFTVIEHILDGWKGNASRAAAQYSAGLLGAAKSQVRITGWLADSLMAYTGIMVSGRRQMLDLMRAFRETMRNRERSTAQDDRAFFIGVAAAVVSLMVSAGAAIITAESGGLGAAITAEFVKTSIDLTTKALDQGEKTKQAVAGDDYADIAVSYLEKAGEIVMETKYALHALVNNYSETNPMSNLVLDNHWAEVPPPLDPNKV